MFNRGSTTSNSTGFNDSLESKYTVAEILSSMTRNTPLTPTTLPSTGTYSSGSVTGTTPTLTPTTLHNLEQTFLDFQNNPATSSASSGHSNATQGRESGFVPPIVHAYNTTTTPVMVQVKSEVDENSLGSEQDLSLSMADNNSWVNNEDSNSSNFNVPNIDPNTYLVANSRRPTGPRKLKKEELLSPEELERRKVRRERNKQAAAKCRQRRENHTSRLINETEGLEEQKQQLENEIQTLAQQKEQLEFILQAHKTNCQVIKPNKQLKHRSHPYAPPAASTTSITVASTNFCSSRPNSLPIPSTVANANTVRLPSASSATNVVRQPSVTTATGVAISTPSTGICMFNFDHSIVEGHTELTPVICGPASIVSTTNTISCSGQEAKSRRSTDSSSSNNDVSSPTLMAL